MTLRRQIIIWSVAFLAILALLWLLGAALAPFVTGIALAYFLDPVVDAMQRRGMGRTTATGLIVCGGMILGVLALIFLFPVVFHQARELITNAPAAVESFAKWVDETASRVAPGVFPDSANSLDQAAVALREHAQEWGPALIGRIWSGGLIAFQILMFAIITPVVTFYLLLDWDRMLATLDRWLPREHAPVVRRLSLDVNDVLAGFIRGQLTVCLIVGAFYAVALSIIGLNYAVLVGAVGGLFSFIPFVGSLIGFALSMGVALAQFWGDWVSIAMVAGVFIFGQILEGNFLTPKLMGEHVGLHPVWLMFAMAAFGVLFGFVGLLVAVPAAASIGVLTRYAMHRYLDSQLYLGRPEAVARAHEACWPWDESDPRNHQPETEVMHPHPANAPEEAEPPNA